MKYPIVIFILESAAYAIASPSAIKRHLRGDSKNISLVNVETIESGQKEVLNSTEPIKEFHTVIIGAGAAGLSASYTLINNGIPSSQVKVLEVSHILGGRARKDMGFTAKSNGGVPAFPLDIGPSFVQYYRSIRRIIGRDDVMAWPSGTGLPIFVNYTWADFFEDYIAPSDPQVVEYLCKVNAVDYSPKGDSDGTNKTLTTCVDGRAFLSDFVIVTVPLPILKDGDIDFRPALPTSMTIGHPGHMWQGFKVFLEFTKDFSYDSCIPSLAPNYGGSCINYEGENLFWDYSSVHHELKSGHTLLAGFVLGDQSLPYINKSDDEIAAEMVKLLDDESGGVASETYVRSFVMNWSKDPNIRGTLSSWGYDKPRSEGGFDHPSGAQNVNDKVWVAGEAFPIDQENGWVDAGAFSGDDAAKQVLMLDRGLELRGEFWKRVRRDLN